LPKCQNSAARQVGLPNPGCVQNSLQTTTVKNRFPNAQIVQASKETDDGKTEYEVGLNDKGKKLDVMVTPEGNNQPQRTPSAGKRIQAAITKSERGKRKKKKT